MTILTCQTLPNRIRWARAERLEHLFEARCDQLQREGRSGHPSIVTDEGSVTFDALDRLANQVARYLLRIGVQPGDCVGLLLDRKPTTHAAMLGVLKAGAAYVPLDASFPKDRVAYIVEDAGVSTILSRSLYRPNLKGINGQHVYLDEIEADLVQERDERPGDVVGRLPDDALCYIIYTSGTTGRPKGVAIDHSSICNFVGVAAEAYGVRDSDRFYQGMTIAFDFSVEELWVPLIAGATLVPNCGESNLVGADLAAFLQRHEITAMCCVPTLLATLEHDLPKLRFLLVSGEACPQDLVTRWHRDGRTILNAYGPTEATVSCTWTELRPDRPVTIGQPLPTYSAVILEPDGDDALPTGETGEICIGGIGLAREYVNRPDLTERAFVPDTLGIPNNPSGRIYRTGDLGRITEQGEIECLGRIDTQVKIRGYRIELTEIESVLLEVPEIAQAVVSTYRAEADAAPELAAYYTLRDGEAEPPAGELSRAVRARLPRYMVPAWFERLDEIPMLPSHKADRSKLPAPSGGRAVNSDRFVPPADEIESAAVTILSELLGVERVSVTDDFFDDLGGHSLLMARFCSRFRTETGRNVFMRDVYLNPTVRELAVYLETNADEQDLPIEPARPHRIPTRRAYYGCGAAQAAFYLAAVTLAVWMIATAVVWIASAPEIWGRYLRTVTLTAGALAGGVIVPVAAKWLLIGRFREQTFPIWGASYLRFWFVNGLVQTSPLAMFKGHPLFNVYLRLLGARIGREVVLQCKRVPICADLVEVGDGTIFRTDSFLNTYRASHNEITLGTVTVGRDCYVGDASVLDIGARMEDGASLGHASSLQTGQVIPAGRNWHGSPAQECRTEYGGPEPRRPGILRKLIYAAVPLAELILLFPALLVWLVPLRLRKLRDGIASGAHPAAAGARPSRAGARLSALRLELLPAPGGTPHEQLLHTEPTVR